MPLVVLPDPGRELGIGEHPVTGLGVREPKSFQPSQRGLDTPGRRCVFPGSNAQCAAKRLTEWLFGAVSQRLRDCTLDGGQRKPGPGVAEFDGKAIPDLLESGADGETRVEKRRLDQNPEEVRITMQPFEGGKHFVPPQRPLRHLLEDIEDMIDEWFAEGGGSPIGVAK